MKRPLLLVGIASATLVLTATATAASAAPARPRPASPSTPSGLPGGVTHDQNPGVPVGASWTNAYFSAPQAGSPTAVTLHADVLRPADLPASARTPVILSVGPYFNHAGQTGKETDTYQPTSRFDDLIDGAQLMKRGYTVVLVDDRGFGGSTGCLDWLGRGEQADISSAIGWAAKQPWSTGKVGMYGKSYDAVTGLWGADLDPQGKAGLKAVVAQEPLWDMYPYLYSNDVPRPNQTGTPLAYNSIASLPGTSGDSARYNQASTYETQHPECLTRNLHDNVVNTSAGDRYWKIRNQSVEAQGSRVPLFFTQGFTESNTKPEETERYLANHQGYEHGWMGPWEHVRGNEVDPDTNTLSQGRKGFFDEVVRFYDRFLKGIEPSVKDPAFAIQDNVGTWRAQSTWPGTKARSLVDLGSGRYIDSGPVTTPSGAARTGKGLSADQSAQQRARQVPLPVTRRSGGDMDQQVRTSLGTAAQRATRSLAAAGSTPSSYQTWSRPVTQDTRITATPRVVLNTTGQGQVYVSLWDVDPATQQATLINENVAQLTSSGRTFDLKGMDWTLRKGHRLAVGIGTITSDGWNALPSGRVVKVKDAQILLAAQSTANDVPTQGQPSPWLARYIADNTIASGDIPKGTFSVPTP